MLKDTVIKHRTYYPFKDMINTENFDSNLLKIGLLKSCTKTLIFIILDRSQLTKLMIIKIFTV